MDGAPLVRFIIDDELKPGKFEVVAELVSAPIVSQLRAEEMQRYGLESQAPLNQQPPVQNPATGQPAPAQNYASSGIDVMAEDPQVYDDYPAAPSVPPIAGAAGAVAPVAGAAANAAGNQTVRFDNRTPQPAMAGRHMPHQPRLIDLTTNRSFPLAKDRILLGRALSSDIAIEDLNVSRTHAEIRQEAANAWSIADLGSTNGTLVNGRHIASVMLQEGDRVTVGTTTFLFTFQ